MASDEAHDASRVGRLTGDHCYLRSDCKVKIINCPGLTLSDSYRPSSLPMPVCDAHVLRHCH
jgi:hypothetical protein